MSLCQRLKTETQVMVKRGDEQAFAALHGTYIKFVEDSARSLYRELAGDECIMDFQVSCSHLESRDSRDAVSVICKGVEEGLRADFSDFQSLVCVEILSGGIQLDSGTIRRLSIRISVTTRRGSIPELSETWPAGGTYARTKATIRDYADGPEAMGRSPRSREGVRSRLGRIRSPLSTVPAFPFASLSCDPTRENLFFPTGFHSLRTWLPPPVYLGC